MSRLAQAPGRISSCLDCAPPFESAKPDWKTVLPSCLRSLAKLVADLRGPREHETCDGWRWHGQSTAGTGIVLSPPTHLRPRSSCVSAVPGEARGGAARLWRREPRDAGDDVVVRLRRRADRDAAGCFCGLWPGPRTLQGAAASPNFLSVYSLFFWFAEAKFHSGPNTCRGRPANLTPPPKAEQLPQPFRQALVVTATGSSTRERRCGT